MQPYVCMPTNVPDVLVAAVIGLFSGSCVSRLRMQCEQIIVIHSEGSIANVATLQNSNTSDK